MATVPWLGMSTSMDTPIRSSSDHSEVYVVKRQHIPLANSHQPQPNQDTPFNPAEILQRIDIATKPFPKAAMFELAERGFDSTFHQLIACILSIRTYDETSLPAAERLLHQAGEASAMAQLTVPAILSLIRPVTFAERKAVQISKIAEEVENRYGGELPCDPEIMRSFAGVGPKCANLAAGVACGFPSISVDIHVHRVTNRWGIVHTSSPEKTMIALQKTVPTEHWLELNRLLVPFGKHICTGRRPLCSSCPVQESCARVGVSDHR